VFAYYSMAIDDFQMRQHPDWAFIDRDGQPCTDIGFRWGCLNSPYGEFAETQLEEILAGYSIDALWLDIYALGPVDRDCVCQWCQRKYGATHGGDLLALEDREAFGTWKVECLEAQLARILALRDQYRPEALVAFNGAGAGFRRHPEAGLAGLRLFEQVDFLSDEGHDVRFESAMAKAMRAHAKPFEILTSDGIANEWAGFVTKPAGLLSLEGSVVGSHGGSFGLGVTVIPNGDMPVGELEIIADAAGFLREREPWFGPQPTAANVRILIQPFRPANEFEPPEKPPQAPRLPRGGSHHVREVRDADAVANGLWDALRVHHASFDFVHEYQDLDRSSIDVLFLQGNARLTDEVCERIRRFVAQGGSVIAEGHASLLDGNGDRRDDFRLADVLGVHFSGYTGAWDANYLQLDAPELAAGLPHYPLLIAGVAIDVRTDGADVLARVIPPIGGEQRVDHHTGALYNPPGAVSSSPAITSHAFGRGRAVYVAHDLGAYITRRRDVDPWAKRLVVNLLNLAPGSRIIRTDAPPGVELVLNRAPHGGLWLHLLNHYGASSMLGTEAGPTLAAIRIELDESRLGRLIGVSAKPQSLALDIDRTASPWVAVVAPPFDIHQVLDIRINTA
jgi:hypothetical protein